MIINGVRFETGGKTYDFDPGKKKYNIGDFVLVKTKDGIETARVVYENADFTPQGDEQVAPIIRKVNDEDLRTIEDNKLEEEELFKTFKEKTISHNLKLKPIRAKLSFDRKKVIFIYNSEGRVDFRELLKDLISSIRKKIELRQIDNRVEAGVVGGIGICGRRCCCSTFLSTGKVKVGIKTAKEQGLTLNVEKLSGLCSHMKCCLGYESKNYQELSKDMPKRNKNIIYNKQEYRIVDINLLKQEITLRERIEDVDKYGNKLLGPNSIVVTKEEFLKGKEDIPPPQKKSKKPNPKESNNKKTTQNDSEKTNE